MAVASYTVLFVACKIGEDVNAANRLLLEKTYTFHWYKMPAKYQLLIRQVICSRQNARVIKMGPFKALNYETSTFVS